MCPGVGRTCMPRRHQLHSRRRQAFGRKIAVGHQPAFIRVPGNVGTIVEVRGKRGKPLLVVGDRKIRVLRRSHRPLDRIVPVAHDRIFRVFRIGRHHVRDVVHGAVNLESPAQPLLLGRRSRPVVRRKHMERIERPRHLDHRVQRPARHFRRGRIHVVFPHLVRGQHRILAPDSQQDAARKSSAAVRRKHIVRIAQRGGSLQPRFLIKGPQLLKAHNVRLDTLKRGQHRGVIGVVGGRPVASRVNAVQHIVRRNAELDALRGKGGAQQRHSQPAHDSFRVHRDSNPVYFNRR